MNFATTLIFIQLIISSICLLRFMGLLMPKNVITFKSKPLRSRIAYLNVAVKLIKYKF